MAHITHLDPNLRWLLSTFHLVFLSDDYRFEATVEVKGHVVGFSGFDCAIGVVFDQLDAAKGEMTLVRPNGDSLLVEVDDEDELREMLVSAQVIATRPYSPNEERPS